MDLLSFPTGVVLMRALQTETCPRGIRAQRWLRRSKKSIVLLLLVLFVPYAMGCAAPHTGSPLLRSDRAEVETGVLITGDSARHEGGGPRSEPRGDARLAIADPGRRVLTSREAGIPQSPRQEDEDRTLGTILLVGLGLAVAFVVWITLYETSGGE